MYKVKINGKLVPCSIKRLYVDSFERAIVVVEGIEHDVELYSLMMSSSLNENITFDRILKETLDKYPIDRIK